jgi:hypothetical protein
MQVFNPNTLLQTALKTFLEKMRLQLMLPVASKKRGLLESQIINRDLEIRLIFSEDYRISQPTRDLYSFESGSKCVCNRKSL